MHTILSFYKVTKNAATMNNMLSDFAAAELDTGTEVADALVVPVVVA